MFEQTFPRRYPPPMQLVYNSTYMYPCTAISARQNCLSATEKTKPATKNLSSPALELLCVGQSQLYLAHTKSKARSSHAGTYILHTYIHTSCYSECLDKNFCLSAQLWNEEEGLAIFTAQRRRSLRRSAAAVVNGLDSALQDQAGSGVRTLSRQGFDNVCLLSWAGLSVCYNCGI